MYEDHVYVRCVDVVVADQFAVAVVEVVVVVVVGGQRRRRRRLPCTFDVHVLGACLPSGVAAVGVRFSFPQFFLHCALIWVVVCSGHLDLVFVCLLKKKKCGYEYIFVGKKFKNTFTSILINFNPI